MAIMKRYRLVIDYEVEISDWAPSGWHAAQDYPDFGTPTFDEWAENQHRLFDMFMKNPKRVELMCQRSLLDTLEMDVASARRRFAVPEEDSLFLQTFAEMPAQDEAYWQNICEKGLFGENADFVTYRFQSSLENCTMQNLETGELTEMQPSSEILPPMPLGEANGNGVFRDIEAFRTEIKPTPEPYAPNWKKIEILRKQIVVEESMPANVKKFLQMFVVQRTIFAHVDSGCAAAEISDEQIVQEANEWTATQPALSKQDLFCLKTIMRKFGLPKLFRETFLQDMRGQAFPQLCNAALKENRFL